MIECIEHGDFACRSLNYLVQRSIQSGGCYGYRIEELQKFDYYIIVKELADLEDPGVTVAGVTWVKECLT